MIAIFLMKKLLNLSTRQSMDASHRRHLRAITDHCWPKSLISNQALYKLCNKETLSSKVAKQSWSMLAQSYAWTLTRPLRGHWTSPLLAHKPINPD